MSGGHPERGAALRVTKQESEEPWTLPVLHDKAATPVPTSLVGEKKEMPLCFKPLNVLTLPDTHIQVAVGSMGQTRKHENSRTLTLTLFSRGFWKSQSPVWKERTDHGFNCPPDPCMRLEKFAVACFALGPSNSTGFLSCFSEKFKLLGNWELH